MTDLVGAMKHVVEMKVDKVGSSLSTPRVFDGLISRQPSISTLIHLDCLFVDLGDRMRVLSSDLHPEESQQQRRTRTEKGTSQMCSRLLPSMRDCHLHVILPDLSCSLPTLLALALESYPSLFTCSTGTFYMPKIGLIAGRMLL